MNSFNIRRSYLEGPADFCVLIQGINWGAEMAHWQFSDDAEQELWDVLGSNPAPAPLNDLKKVLPLTAQCDTVHIDNMALLFVIASDCVGCNCMCVLVMIPWVRRRVASG